AGLERTDQRGDALARPALSAGVDWRNLARQSRLHECGPGGLSTLGLAPVDAAGGTGRRKSIDPTSMTPACSRSETPVQGPTAADENSQCIHKNRNCGAF